MVSSHDFRASTYVEESDWTACTVGSAVIGGGLCVVRKDWSVVTGLIAWARSVDWYLDGVCCKARAAGATASAFVSGAEDSHFHSGSISK